MLTEQTTRVLFQNRPDEIRIVDLLSDLQKYLHAKT